MDLDQVKSYNEDVAKLREQRDADYAEYEKAGRIWGLVPRERITKIKFPRVKKEIIDRYYALEDMSTTVSDILDGYGIDGAIPTSYLKPVIPGSKIVGPAVTIRNILRHRAHMTMISLQCLPVIFIISASRAMFWYLTSAETWKYPIWADRVVLLVKAADLQETS